MILHRLKRCPAVVTSCQLHIIKLIPVHGRCTQCPNFSDFHQIVQGFHRFFNWGFVVKPVNDIEIQIICSQTLQCAINFSINGFFRKPPRIKIDFRGKNDFITGNILFQSVSQIMFTCASRIAICRIKKVDTQIQSMFDNRFGFCFIQRPIMHDSSFSETHTTNTNFGNCNICIPQLCIFHFSSLLLFFRQFPACSYYMPFFVHL